ncbi:MAG: hypothetical protein R3F54_26410 [Alphaproteobacteria bacterium]
MSGDRQGHAVEREIADDTRGVGAGHLDCGRDEDDLGEGGGIEPLRPEQRHCGKPSGGLRKLGERGSMVAVNRERRIGRIEFEHSVERAEARRVVRHAEVTRNTRLAWEGSSR